MNELIEEPRKMKLVPSQRSVIERPRTIDEAASLANIMAKSDIVPYHYRGKPNSVLIAIGLGDSLGLNPFQSVQGIAVINGQPCIYGDIAKGLTMSSQDCEYIKERPLQEVGEKAEGWCQVKRRGHDPITVTFSKQDAVTAKLWGKRGKEGQDTPWITYPWRMLQMRARLFAMRDAFPDIFKGIKMVEEVMDYQVVDTETYKQTASETDMMPHKTTEKPETAAPASTPAEETITPEEAQKLVDEADKSGVPARSLVDHLSKKYGITYIYEVTKSIYQEVLNWCKGEGWK